MKPKIAPSYAFVVDVKTEAWYLQMLKRNERKINVAIRPELAQKKSLSAQFEQVCELAESYSEVLWVMDMDTIIKELHENPNSRINVQLSQYVDKLPANAHFIPNVPCLEYWFLLHVKQTSRYYTTYKSLERELHLTDILANYEKSERYFTGSNDIYKRLRPYLENAVYNAKLLPELDFSKLEVGICGMYKIINALNIIN